MWMWWILGYVVFLWLCCRLASANKRRDPDRGELPLAQRDTPPLPHERNYRKVINRQSKLIGYRRIS